MASSVTVLSGIGGVVVAKPRTVVAFGLVLRLRVSKVSTLTGIGGVVVAKRRTVVTFRLVLRPCVSKVSTVTGIGGGRGRETQNCRHFWTSERGVVAHSGSLVADLGSLVADSGFLVADSAYLVADSGLLVADSRAWWLKPDFSLWDMLIDAKIQSADCPLSSRNETFALSRAFMP